MKTKYHIEITHKALQDYFSQASLKVIIKANTRQDRIQYQFNHDHYHFDGSAFREGFEYIDCQHEQVILGVVNSSYDAALLALGRLLHTWQDFYSHSNYVSLWVDKAGSKNPDEIKHNDESILDHPNLISGKNYGIVEFIAMVPGISKLIKPLLPADSHARMNLDSPTSGSLFDYAYWAALKRTIEVQSNIFYELKTLNISKHKINLFKGQ